MEDYAETITAERVKRVIKGYGSTGSPQVEGTGGNFDYYELGHPMFKEDGNLNEEVGVEKIRQYIWYTETKTRYKLGDISDKMEDKNTYNTSLISYNSFLGKHNDTAYYFYYEKDNLTTLSMDTLNIVTEKAEQYLIYADHCLLDKEYMMAKNIIFKKIPRDIRRF